MERARFSVRDQTPPFMASEGDIFMNDIGELGEDDSFHSLLRSNAIAIPKKPESPDSTTDTCPFGCCVTETLGSHVFKAGLLDGLYSDVTIEAFGEPYMLHKLFLHKSSYFRTLFEWQQRASEESDGHSESEESEQPKEVIKLEFEDPAITSDSFKLVVSRLYGNALIGEERDMPKSMIAVGQYLGIPDVVCHSTNYIVNTMSMANVADYLQFATRNDYGSASSKIVECGKGILCSDGWQCGAEAWNGIPAQIVAEVVGEDYFFVPSEWDRCMFIIKLIELRGSDDFDDEQALRDVLNSKVHFCHLAPEQLQDLESFFDINGEPYVDPHVLRTALWQGVYLQRKIVMSRDVPQLGLAVQSEEEPDDGSRWYSVPTHDETWSALPSQLSKFLFKHSRNASRSSLDLPETKTTDKEPPVPTWTKIPPFRFSVAFANISELSKDKRVYGKTFWYAGSYWNLYLQKNHIESKNTFQVGVYLHRASSSSPSPSRNGIANPDIFAGNPNLAKPPRRFSAYKRGFSLDTEDELLKGFDTLSLSTSSPRREPPKDRSFLTYEDARTSIRVYFVIFTPTRKAKPLITSFLSVPNDFNRSQSWGWKSNSMCVFNDDGTFPEDHDPNMKFTVVLGAI